MRRVRECSVDGCTAISGVPGTARGLCNKHYTRAKRHGDPLHTEVFAGTSLQEHFDYYATHRPDDGCWLWQGYFGPFGYGIIHSGGRTVQAHRVSFEVAVRPLEAGEIVRHRCDNPPCVNPLHLEAGTHQDNSDDKWSRGRGNPPAGERHPQSKLTERDVILIRDVLGQGVYSQTYLATLFGVSSQAVWAVANNRTWRTVAGSANASSRGVAA